MNRASCHLLYLSHGPEAYAMEAAYSILSARGRGEFSGPIHVVTDHAECLQQLLGQAPNIHFLPLSAEDKKSFVGPTGYVHRLKPQAIAWATRQFSQPGDHIVFLDTDTALLHPIQPWLDQMEEGLVILNECEGAANAIPHATRSQKRAGDFFRRASLDVKGKTHPLDPTTPLWNSGVIGFSSHQVHWFDEATDWIDAMWPLLAIHTVEQCAFSAVLHAHRLPLEESGEIVFHYHWFKEFRQDLMAFFQHLGKHASYAERLALWPSIQPDLRVVPKKTFLKKPKWQRSLLRRMGRNWQPLPYAWQT